MSNKKVEIRIKIDKLIDKVVINTHSPSDAMILYREIKSKMVADLLDYLKHAELNLGSVQIESYKKKENGKK